MAVRCEQLQIRELSHFEGLAPEPRWAKILTIASALILPFSTGVARDHYCIL